MGMATPKSVPNSHGRPNLPYSERVTKTQPTVALPKAAADLEDDEEEVVFDSATDRTQEDMEVIVTALFKSRPKKKTEVLPEDEATANENPLHPLQFSDKDTPSSTPLLSGNQKRRFAKLLELPRGQEALVKQLNQQRSKRTEIEEGFDELATAMHFVLDKCRENHDVHNAKMAMMLSQVSHFYNPHITMLVYIDLVFQTFYRETVPVDSKVTEDGEGRARANSTSQRGTREYLKTALIAHPLWEDVSFWDEACWQSISESVKEGKAEVLWHDMKPLEQRDAVLRIHNIVFSQVGAYAHSMLEFGCKPALARKFVLRLAATYELAEDQKDMLLDLVENAASK